MTMQHPGTYPISQRGATRQSCLSVAQTLLQRLMSELTNPYDDEERHAILTEYRRIARNDPACVDAMMDYWIPNNYRIVLRDYQPSPAQLRQRIAARRKSRAARVEATTKIMQHVDAAIDQRAQIKLLDLMLPNGKALRECTGSDCRKLSYKMGSWLAKVADHVKPNQIVGDVLQEADIRKFYGREVAAA